MSLVERLGERWDSWVGSDEWLEAGPEKDVRFFLNAIADELDNDGTGINAMADNAYALWLRNAAKEE